MFISTVGMIGFASASYCWSRVASAVGRLSQYLVSNSANAWHMVVADDYHMEAGGAHDRHALFVLFLSVVRRGWHSVTTEQDVWGRHACRLFGLAANSCAGPWNCRSPKDARNGSRGGLQIQQLLYHTHGKFSRGARYKCTSLALERCTPPQDLVQRTLLVLEKMYSTPGAGAANTAALLAVGAVDMYSIRAGAVHTARAGMCSTTGTGAMRG